MQIISVVTDKTDSFNLDVNHLTLCGKVASVIRTDSSDAMNCAIEFIFNDVQFEQLKLAFAAL